MKNNSIKLMIVGKQRKGKTTLLSHLSRVGNFEDSGTYQHSEEPNAKTFGIKLGIWKYCKNRGSPSNEFPTIEFYSWDYAGDVCYRKTVYINTHMCIFYLFAQTSPWK